MKTVTKAWGKEITWNIGGTCDSKALGKYENNQEDTQQCCVKDNEKFVITCKDSYGDGWHDGYLEINGKKYCGDFSWGKEFLDELKATDLDGSGGQGLIIYNFLTHSSKFHSIICCVKNLITLSLLFRRLWNQTESNWLPNRRWGGSWAIFITMAGRSGSSFW